MNTELLDDTLDEIFEETDSEDEMEDMNMNTELLDDTLDGSFEETDSEDEMEELETEVSEHTERWAYDSDFKKIPFEGNPGPGIFTVFCHTRKFDRRAERRFRVKLS
ncbi:hypothetical protein AVEN_36311-1 [Araneus ventricosus]|uniref:Uncharacterized protein n=1 Tax=Araneus ventricosus TaxID=182803 RepID=A0A4Y2QXF8_ARAVE|nr:hypothetical protein AVEN_36311-1 [Araneus ventricosus]